MKFKPVPSIFHEIRCWGSKAHNRSYLISQCPGIGYTASWNDCVSLRPGPAKFLDGGPFDSLNQAIEACRSCHRQTLQ